MNTDLTKESYFLLPFIDVIDLNFVNIFSEDQNRPYLDKNYFIVHTANDAKDLYIIQNYYKDKSGFIKMYSDRIDGVFHYIFAFTADQNFNNDYELFISNNHKNISKEVASKITLFWNYKGIGCTIFDQTFKRSYIPHSDYVENILDIIINQSLP